ncbi:Outer membrane usher protein fimD precursor [Serratia quinivorans]|nr:Outer membrane usher protein fimD precursor [Serratia quinivorans]
MPYLTPYRRTEVALSPDTLPDDVDIPQSSRRVTPTRGALVRADFMPKVGARVLMTLTQANGQPVPFGATVSDSDPAAAPGGSIVGDGGQVYLSGVAPQGNLRVKWGNGNGEQCRVSYQLSQAVQPGGIGQMDGVCR